jgi:hypothetical protein
MGFRAAGWLGQLLLLAVLIVVPLGIVPTGLNPVWPALAATTSAYICGGDSLEALADNGAVDAVGIPNQAAGTVPGAFVVLRWRGVSLQLPRTNNAGAPSYTDGQWWWSLEDPERPRFQRGRGAIETFPCERVGLHG